MVKIGFIGAGNMASALIKAIIGKGITDNFGLIASDTNSEKLMKLEKELEIGVSSENKEVVEKSDIIFLAVKPKDIEKVLNEIKDKITEDKIIISIAAGIRIKQIEKIIGLKKIVRIMPNTPCLVGEMAAGYTVNNKLSEAEISTIEIILESAGIAIKLSEDKLDSVTGLSGSGPAFVAKIIEDFTQSGIKNGLSKEVSKKLTLQTFKGTAKLLETMDASELIDMVTSPGGTTAAGRKVLDKSDVSKVIEKTVSKAVEKSCELGS